MATKIKDQKNNTLTARVRSRHQVTLPQQICEAMDLTEGAILSVSVSKKRKMIEPGMIILAPQVLSQRPWSEKEWKLEEAEVDEEIKSGKLSRRYKGAKNTIAALKRKQSS